MRITSLSFAGDQIGEILGDRLRHTYREKFSGTVGTLIVMKEGWRLLTLENRKAVIEYRIDGTVSHFLAGGGRYAVEIQRWIGRLLADSKRQDRWRPGAQLPRFAARATLRVTDISEVEFNDADDLGPVATQLMIDRYGRPDLVNPKLVRIAFSRLTG